MSIELMTIAMFVVLIATIVTGLPLAYCLAGVATLFGLIDNGWNVASLFDMFANNCWGLMNNYVIVAIPLFILMAQLLDRSKVSEKLFDALFIVLGSIKGGLGMAVVLVCTVFAATTGIIGASVVAMGLLATPALLNKGYQKEMTSGIICAAGTLGILIPPSIMLVIYGGLTGLKETSVGNLFAGAIFPGLILASLYFLYILIRCNISPELGPPISKDEAKSWSVGQKWAMTLKSMVPPLALILAVMGTILAGIASGSIALIAFSAARLTRPALALRQAEPWSRRMSATSISGRATFRRYAGGGSSGGGASVFRPSSGMSRSIGLITCRMTFVATCV